MKLRKKIRKKAKRRKNPTPVLRNQDLRRVVLRNLKKKKKRKLNPKMMIHMLNPSSSHAAAAIASVQMNSQKILPAADASQLNAVL